MAGPERDPDATSGPRRMAVIAAATVLGGMIAAVGVIGSESLEPRLTAATRAALADAGFTSVDVRFDGREAFLSSETATPERLAAAERVAERVEGVRWATSVSGSATPQPEDPDTPTPTPTPSPTPTPGPDTVEILTGTTVLFAADSVSLSDAALAQISQVAAVLTDYPTVRLTVTGHIAIPTGTAADALAFSERRAQAVVDELVRLGVPASRLEAVGAGASDPIGDNATAAGAAQNRRVVFAIQEDS
jgi:outer membrane protein OmpA-like peptidoglycan-associated protein